MSVVKNLKPVFTEDAITQRLDELGNTISQDYAGKRLVFICVLKGAFMFFSDLCRRVTVEPEIDFVRLASYGMKASTSRSISFTKDIELSIKDKHVILVDDVVDSGHTMAFLLRQMEARGASSIKVAALVDKKERREIKVTVDYPGFILNEGFIVGYGLDFAERYRTMPSICEVEFE